MPLLRVTEPLQKFFEGTAHDVVGLGLALSRALFPFPILGLDTDNGGEFINKTLLSSCEQEQIA